ncbi:four-helix bundle copper-binding protein [Massilia putida]|uniref:four-helix bundle copper-binding protein n=1 Tax=Massilia putida TaxID=1141883 RepID=UPI000951D53B|nr:four-helix bundle copper-binding protein [Massilia putida]
MNQNQFQSCIQACYQCAQACDTCVAACLHEPDPKMMARCIELDDECAAVCRLAAQLMSRSSEHAMQICQLCAEICEACADECAKHQAQHCQECASVCHRCAQECRNMGATNG